MPKIDVMLKMMSEKGVERAILSGDQPYQIFAAGKRVEGSITPSAQLSELLEEITPAPLIGELKSLGTFNFQHPSLYGTFDVGVTHDLGTVKMTLVPASQPASQATAPSLLKPVTPVPPPLSRTAPQTSAPSSSIPPAPPLSPTPVAPTSGAPAPNWPSSGLSTDIVPAPGWPSNPPPQTPNYPPPPAYPPAPMYPNVYPGTAPPGMPYYGDQISPRSKIAGGLLGIFFGGLGIHRFYLGHASIGAIFLVLSLILPWFTCSISFFVACLWGFVEGIIILSGGMRDAEGRILQG